MSPAQWYGVALLVGISLLVITLNRLPNAADDQADWDRTADEAARHTPPAAEAEIALLETWLQVRPRPKNVIPHQTRQTRRTEEDQ
ncbi:hypothetical protein ACIPY6_28490 [Streptomyces sp. NPDC090054]|uniref:hypothetical protein n=1 Tax=Streptomyces sp. NPDC090054 TaxID=3365933 RepID=UPI003805A3D0